MREKEVPRYRLEKIAEELDGVLKFQNLYTSSGRKMKRIIITYHENEEPSNDN